MKRFLLLTFVFLISASAAFASIGVGVGTGKIVVNEKLKSGQIYTLPSISVINTGDQDSDYEVSVTFNQKQDQRFPKEGWFTFSPKKFSLKPKQAQVVDITLSLPLKTQPGDYFAYLEAHPLKKAQSGQANIGVAAATKLSFTISPSNILEAIYYRLLSLWKLYLPYSAILVAALLVVAAAVAFKKFFHLEINLRRSSTKSKNE